MIYNSATHPLEQRGSFILLGRDVHGCGVGAEEHCLEVRHVTVPEVACF